jgi:uncharacterized protein (DUF58 family)
VSGSLSTRVPGLLVLSGTALVAALATGRAELAVLAVPFLLFVGAGLILAHEPKFGVELQVDRSRMLEGDDAMVTLRIRNEISRRYVLEVVLERSQHLTLAGRGPVLVGLPAGGEADVQSSATPARWGTHYVGPVIVRARDPLSVMTWRGRRGRRLALRAFPREQTLRELVSPLSTQPFLGSHVARTRAEGIEFADIRPFAIGDRVRRINWRTTARRGALYVTERHPEHASDVVLLLDTFAEARDRSSETLDAAVRAAASLARGHLNQRDRVALVDFGGTLHWLEPAFGTRQLYRIVDALLASEVAFSYAWRAVDSIPRKLLPPGALILALSPLLDECSVALIVELRRRGADLTVVEISPLDHVEPGPTAGDVLAHRLWQLQRSALRARLRNLGIGVAVWQERRGQDPTLEEVNAFRRSAGHVARASR